MCVFLCTGPPTLHQAPEDISMPIGATVNFECVVIAVPQANIHWLHNSVPLRVGTHVQVSETGTLTISSVDRLDEGVYECVAENELGSVRAFARLNIRGQ